MIRLGLAVVAAATVVHAHGQSISGIATVPDAELARCASFGTDALRLNCFDQATKKLKPASAPKAQVAVAGQKGKWSTSSDKDPLTDKPIFYAMLDADEGKGKYGGPVSLIVRCKNNSTEAYVNWNSFLGSDGIAVTYRVDKDAAVKVKWSISTDHKASFIRNPIPLLKQIGDSSSFVVSLTPYSESPVTAIFNTSGGVAALADIRSACQW
ncbi:type VI secretion system-associated protein TagO [Xenophilus sp. Marseille-Q4582]|uniref:type VI secretion system-associated protein TagO n=1 Tax=Xenophilus sp. Marseille-Q4582 TaxID=2866600 RepID=UPI001CE3D29B|nr:type VI secretion system-associated protein TagO [Xenophilus sp. Marseille-Q4582]